MNVSRRNFVKGALGMAAMGVLGAAASQAEEIGSASASGGALETRYTVDLLIIGGGMAGLAAGIHAIELGCKNLLIVDKATGEGADWGGSSMVCGGSFLIPVSDSTEDVEAYAQALYA